MLNKLRWLTAILILLAVFGMITGCATAGPQQISPTAKAEAGAVVTLIPAPSPVPPTATVSLPPTATFTLTPLPFTPTNTATMAPSATSSDTPTASPIASATPAPGTQPGALLPGAGGSGNTVKVFLIALSPGGAAGCGGSAVAVSAGIPRTKDIAADIKAALNALFSMKSKYYGSLYNPVSYSTFRVQKIDYENSSGFLTVWLSGKYRPSGNDCDNTWVKAQIWSTAKQFGASSTNFYINGPNPFGDFVSNDK
jgi:hypothetical protein